MTGAGYVLILKYVQISNFVYTPRMRHSLRSYGNETNSRNNMAAQSEVPRLPPLAKQYVDTKI